MNTRHVVVFLLGLFGVLTSAGPGLVSGQEPDPKIQKLTERWTANQAQVRSVRYRVEGTITIPKEGIDYWKQMGPKKNPVPAAKGVVLTDNYVLLLDLSAQRHRLEREKDYYHITTGQIKTSRETATFNGSEFMRKFKHALDGGADVDILTGTMDRMALDLNMKPLFASHGILALSPHDQFIPGKWKATPNVALLRVHGNALHERRRCLVLRSPMQKGAGKTFTEYWVDLERDGVLVRELEHRSDFVREELNIQYQQTAHGWLTSGWEWTHRVWSDNDKRPMVIAVHRFQVKELALNVSPGDADFQVAIRPGMLLRKGHITPELSRFSPPPYRYYRVDKEGKQREVVD